MMFPMQLRPGMATKSVFSIRHSETPRPQAKPRFSGDETPSPEQPPKTSRGLLSAALLATALGLGATGVWYYQHTQPQREQDRIAAKEAAEKALYQKQDEEIHQQNIERWRLLPSLTDYHGYEEVFITPASAKKMDYLEPEPVKGEWNYYQGLEESYKDVKKLVQQVTLEDGTVLTDPVLDAGAKTKALSFAEAQIKLQLGKINTIVHNPYSDNYVLELVNGTRLNLSVYRQKPEDKTAFLQAAQARFDELGTPVIRTGEVTVATSREFVEKARQQTGPIRWGIELMYPSEHLEKPTPFFTLKGSKSEPVTLWNFSAGMKPELLREWDHKAHQEITVESQKKFIDLSDAQLQEVQQVVDGLLAIPGNQTSVWSISENLQFATHPETQALQSIKGYEWSNHGHEARLIGSPKQLAVSRSQVTSKTMLSSLQSALETLPETQAVSHHPYSRQYELNLKNGSSVFLNQPDSTADHQTFVDAVKQALPGQEIALKETMADSPKAFLKLAQDPATTAWGLEFVGPDGKPHRAKPYFTLTQQSGKRVLLPLAQEYSAAKSLIKQMSQLTEAGKLGTNVSGIHFIGHPKPSSFEDSVIINNNQGNRFHFEAGRDAKAW